MRDIIFLEGKAKWVRRQTLEMCAGITGGHLAASLSCTDILVSLYYDFLRYNARNPGWDDRDRFILSKGHAAPALYPILADLGFFDKSELNRFCRINGILGAHPDTGVPGVEVVTGSLGHGLGIGAGLALRAKADGRDYRTVVLMSDGECYEGSTWEAASFASHHGLGNLIGVIDRNGLSATDFTEKALRLEPLEMRWRSFGWYVTTIDGHSFDALNRELMAARYPTASEENRPHLIVATTIKGRGISFMENVPLAHTMIPQGEELETARRELHE